MEFSSSFDAPLDDIVDFQEFLKSIDGKSSAEVQVDAEGMAEWDHRKKAIRQEAREKIRKMGIAEAEGQDVEALILTDPEEMVILLARRANGRWDFFECDDDLRENAREMFGKND